MGERKVLNKYYPADFDPTKLPRVKQPKNQQMKVRMMLPMSIRCNTCGNYIYKGTKFNSRKEQEMGETHLDIAIFRFYLKCTKCSAEITFKTDPQNSDYIVESGASRNFEPWRAADEAVERGKMERDAEEMGNAMKYLENRTADSKWEMEGVVAFDELTSIKSRHAKVTFDELLAAALKGSDSAEDKKRIKQDQLDGFIAKNIYSSKVSIKRIPDEEEEEDHDSTDATSPTRTKFESTHMPKKVRAPSVLTGFILKPASAMKKTTDGENTALASLCQNYEDDEDT